LREYGVKATFFCIGDNVRKYPELYNQILAEGHRVGNHSYSHYNAWKVSAEAYLQDVEDGARLIESNLFRPPYGKLTWQVLIPLRKKYRIVMWDVISCDFDETVSAEQVYRNVTENARPGSVIVFHDSIKAAPRMIEALPAILNFYSERAYQFKIIHPAIL
jgi:peptidoglycan/xylan/chitin deacetylase (PgdA/CDA1 family)